MHLPYLLQVYCEGIRVKFIHPSQNVCYCSWNFIDLHEMFTAYSQMFTNVHRTSREVHQNFVKFT